MTEKTSFYADALHRQFCSALMMLGDVIDKMPEELWEKPMWKVHDRNQVFSQPWYIIYHTLFFADLYLETTDDNHHPPAPFTLDELDPSGISPNYVLTKADEQSFLTHILAKANRLLPDLTDDKAKQLATFSWGFSLPYYELVIDNIRHIQEHTSQCYMFMGQLQKVDQNWRSGDAL